MGHSCFFSVSLCLLLLLLFSGCSAQFEQSSYPGQPQQRQPRFRTECQIQNLNAVEPKHRFNSEAGVTEFWDQNENQFQCAGVAALRHRIHRGGLLLPSFNNAPQLVYVVQGRGIQGAVFPGCPESYQSRSQQGRQQSFNDPHQKIEQIKEGDILAYPIGVVHWIYNNGESPLVLVSLVDVANPANQLDLNFRKFFLAGNPQEGLVRGGQRGQEQEQEHEQEQEQRGSSGNNIFSGFDEQMLAQVFGIDSRLARKLQNQNDKRGAIVKCQREFDVGIPQRQEEEWRQQGSESEEEEEGQEQEQEPERRQRRKEREQGGKRGERGSPNSLQLPFCAMKLKFNINNPSLADIFNPRGGRLTIANSFNFPILQFLQLSAEKLVLYENALYAPQYSPNAHSIVYVTKGSGRFQIVRENGDAVFDEQVRAGQMIVVPQHFAVLGKAGNQGLEIISFKTNANAQGSQIAGPGSFFRAIPLDVLVNSYGISRDQARRLKDNRQHEVAVFRPFSRSMHQEG